MVELLEDALSDDEVVGLSSVVQVGDATYQELMENNSQIFNHQYFADTRGRIRTKLMQIQCEIESRNPNFPFKFRQRKFPYGGLIPELYTKNVIIHVARSSSPDVLPYNSKYKVSFSNKNALLRRQIVLDFDNAPPFSLEPFYGILVFGGENQTFSVVQFPEPGYEKIAESIVIPQVVITSKPQESETLERKKAILKKEFLVRSAKEAFS